MILPVDPNSSLLIRAAAETALLLHIGGGAVGLAAGAVALLARKGRKWHRISGTVFLVAMLVMSGVGAIVALLLPQRISAVAGGLTFYLVLTGWMTVRRRVPAWLQIINIVGAMVVAGAGLFYGQLALHSPHGTLDGLPYQPAFVFGSLAALGAMLDVRVMLARGVTGGPRIARHVWRMCIAMLIATTSLFQGQPQVLPRFLHGSPALWLPSLLVLGSMIYWLIGAWFTRHFKPTAPA